MKKNYNPPMIIFESFQLNAAVATSCSSTQRVAINFSKDTCTALQEAGQPYFSSSCGTDITSPDEAKNDFFCYQGPIEATSIFLES